jgi:hypothetical protein
MNWRKGRSFILVIFLAGVFIPLIIPLEVIPVRAHNLSYTIDPAIEDVAYDSTVGGTANCQSLAKWDVTSIPTGKTVTNATVYLKTETSDEGDNDVMFFYIANQTWTEDDTAADLDSIVEGANTTFTNTFLSSNTWYSFNVTDFFNTNYGNDNFSVAFEDPDYPSQGGIVGAKLANHLRTGNNLFGEPDCDIHSKEDGGGIEGPYLVVFLETETPVASAANILNEPAYMLYLENYTVYSSITDPDGQTDIDYAKLYISDDHTSNMAEFRWTYSTGVFSLDAGSGNVTLHTAECSNASITNGWNITWVFQPLIPWERGDYDFGSYAIDEHAASDGVNWGDQNAYMGGYRDQAALEDVYVIDSFSTPIDIGTWIKFNVSEIPSGQTVVNATISLYCWLRAGSMSLSAHAYWWIPSQTWDESDSASTITGLTRYNYTTQTIQGTSGVWHDLNVTKMFQSNYNNNYGNFSIRYELSSYQVGTGQLVYNNNNLEAGRDDAANDAILHFRSSEYTTESLRPYVTILMNPIVNVAPEANSIYITGEPARLVAGRTFTINASFYDEDGYTDLVVCKLYLSADHATWIFGLNWTESTDTFAIETGSGYGVLYTSLCVSTTSGNWANLTWAFRLNSSWLETDDFDYGVYCEDEVDNSGWSWNDENSAFIVFRPTADPIIIQIIIGWLQDLKRWLGGIGL